MLLAQTDETAASKTATAENAATMTDPNLLDRRFGMPGSFQGQGADSFETVCWGRADVNYC